MTTVRVVIPHTSDAATGGWRDRALLWNLARWKIIFPDAIIDRGTAKPTDNPGSFNRPEALNTLIGLDHDDDVIVIADADTSADAGFALQAVEHAAAGGWALARHYRCLTEEATRAVQAAHPITAFQYDPSLVEAETDLSVSGVVVLPRAAYEAIGGSETRHTGWGSDDTCLAIMLDTLWRPHERIQGSVWHHYHPRPLDHSYGQPNNRRQYLLTERYKEAAGDPEKVRAIIAGRRR